MYEQPAILATFEAADLLGDAYGSFGNGSNIADPSDKLFIGGSIRPI
jgi:hypothetical protein